MVCVAFLEAVGTYQLNVIQDVILEAVQRFILYIVWSVSIRHDMQDFAKYARKEPFSLILHMIDY